MARGQEEEDQVPEVKATILGSEMKPGVVVAHLVILSHERPRQEDYCEFRDSLDYIVSSRLA